MLWTRRSVAATMLQQMSDYRRAQGRRVAELRDAKNWTQEDLARFADISVKTVSRVENGTNELRATTLREFAQALDVSEADLRIPAPAPLGLGAPPEPDLESRLEAIEAKLDLVLALLGPADSATPSGLAEVAAALGAATDRARADEETATQPARQATARRQR